MVVRVDGRCAATRVRKAAPGSAVFETLSDEVYYGVVVERLGLWKQYGAGSNGVVLFERNGCSEKLTFGANDLEVSLLASCPSRPCCSIYLGFICTSVSRTMSSVSTPASSKQA